VTRAVIALGSNLGDRAGNLRSALSRLEERGIAVVARSAVWETVPVPADQPAFLNAAAVVETELAPGALLTTLKETERGLGRRPGRRWGPRPLDLDILYYGDLHLASDSLAIPHPRIGERPFVLAPLVEVLPRGSDRHRWALERLSEAGLEGVRRTGIVL